MIPVGAIVGVIVLLARLRNGEGLTQGHRYATGEVAVVIALRFAVPIALFSVAVLAHSGWVMAPLLVAALVLTFPWTVTRWVLIPLGWPRASYFLSALAVEFGADPLGHRALAAAWALVREPTAEHQAWVRKELEDLKNVPLQGAALVAHGLLAAASGDRETARLLMRGTDHLDPRILPARARRVAVEWSLAEAASRGAWAEVIALSAQGRGARRTAAFFRAAARRLSGEPRPHRLLLLLLWALTLRPWALWPLLRRAWPHPSGPPAAPVEEPVRAEAPLARALRRHADLARVPREHESRALRLAAEAWDEALASEQVRAWVDEQARGMGPDAASRALMELEDQVLDELTRWVLSREEALDVPDLDDLPYDALIVQVMERVHETQLERLELAAVEISGRVETARDLPRAEEWHQFLGLRRAYTRTVGRRGLETRRLAFESVHPALSSLAVRLFNERKERALANAMFRWLLAESLLVGSEEDQRLNRQNVACGP